MTVFKTYLKILEKNKLMLIINLAILFFISFFMLSSSETTGNFMKEEPKILIENKDNGEFSKAIENYMYKNSEKADVKLDEESIRDGFFYREINFSMIIPENFSEDFLKGKDPKITIRSSKDYLGDIGKMTLDKYLNLGKIYLEDSDTVDELIENIEETLDRKVEIEIFNKENNKNFEKTGEFFNFINYSILAGTVYSIGMVMASFRKKEIRKRTIVSSMDYRKLNRKLIFSNGIFAISIWALYMIFGIFFLKDKIFTEKGGLFVLNSFIFNISALCLAFLITNLFKEKEAINGMTNIIALGSSFLTGAFVPAEVLPDTALKIGKVFPSYYYINSNDIIKDLGKINLETLKPVFLNMFVILGFSLVFIIISNILSKKNQIIK